MHNGMDEEKDYYKQELNVIFPVQLLIKAI